MDFKKMVENNLKDMEEMSIQAKESSKKVLGQEKRGRGRPRKKVHKSKLITFKVYQDLFNQVEEKLTEKNMTMTDLLTNYLEEFIGENENE